MFGENYHSFSYSIKLLMAFFLTWCLKANNILFGNDKLDPTGFNWLTRSLIGLGSEELPAECLD